MYDNNKIIAIGDIHGDYYIFIELLKLSKVINSKLEWTGKDTYIVQLGDTLDGKRPDVIPETRFIQESGEIKITLLILNLDIQAKKYGGRVISILGNHEIYPYYYYNDETFNKRYVKTVDLKDYERIYNKTRFNYFKAGNPGAIILGKTRPLILQLGKFIFTHGSLNVKFLEQYANKKGKVNINNINKEVSEWLVNKKSVPKFINGPENDNPLFNRDLTDPKTMCKKDCNNVLEILNFFKNAEYLVMGHSTHKNINTLCNNTIYRIDIAISRAFGRTFEQNMKRLQVLQIRQNDKTGKVGTKIIKPGEKITII